MQPLDSLSAVDALQASSVRPESSSLARFQHYWVHGNGNQWFRIRGTENARISSAETLNAVTVTVGTFEQETRGFLRRLFSKEEDGTLNMPGAKPGSFEVAKRIKGNRTALLVWAKNSNTPLSEVAIRAALPDAESMVPTENNMWLVFGANRPQSPAEAETEKQASEILRIANRHGTVVGDLNAEGAERVVVALKQKHASENENMRHFFEDMQEFLLWIEHQMAIYKLQRDIAEALGVENIHFIIENTRRDRTELAGELSAMRTGGTQVEQLMKPFTRLDDHSYLPQLETDEIGQLARSGRIDEAVEKLALLSGESAFIHTQSMNGVVMDDRVTGLQDAKVIEHADILRNTIQEHLHDLTEAEFDRHVRLALAAWLQKLHPSLMEDLDRDTEKGKATILVLGSVHFRSGSNPVDEFKGLRVEDFFEKEESLKDTRLIIVNPRRLNELQSYEHC